MVGVEEGREFRFRGDLYCTLKRVLSVYFLVVVWILVDVYLYDKKMSYKITFMSFREHKGETEIISKEHVLNYMTFKKIVHTFSFKW